MIRTLFPVLVTLTTLGLAPAQAPSLSLVAEPWGPSCGPELSDAPRAQPLERGFGLTIAGARPNAPLVLVLGNHAADLALPGSVCHLLTIPTATLPLHAGPDGRAETTFLLPFDRAGSLYAQVLQLGTPAQGVVGSRGLAIHALPNERANAVLLARVEAGGTRVQFFQPALGELLVVANGASDVPAPLAQLGAGRMTAVQAYEALSGHRAPHVLRLAAEAAELAAKATGGPAVTPVAPAAAGGATTSPGGGGGLTGPASCLSSSWFRANHCGGNSDFEYCWTDITGNPWVERDCRGIWGVTASVNGTYLFECRYQDWQGWHTTFSTTVSSCEWYYAYNSGIKRDRRVHVLYGTGNWQHFSVRGFN